MTVSVLHEVLVGLFRTRASLAVEMLEALGIPVPEHGALSIVESDLAQALPVEARADLLVRLEARSKTSAKGKRRAAACVVLEVQLRVDATKRWSWPVYVSTARARHRCPTFLLVVTPDRDVARWARRPIPLGGDSQIVPLVLGPEEIPIVTDPGAPIELALLSARAHAEREDVAFAATRALIRLDPSERVEYDDALMGWLSPELRKKVLEMLMENYPYPQSDWAKEHYGRGRLDGKLEADRATLIRLLTRRFGAPSPAQIEVIEAAEALQLEVWLDRVLDAESTEDVLRPNEES